MKTVYHVVQDGIYSHIEVYQSENANYNTFDRFKTFTEAKKVLVQDMQYRYEEWQWALRQVKAIKKSNLKVETED